MPISTLTPGIARVGQLGREGGQVDLGVGDVEIIDAEETPWLIVARHPALGTSWQSALTRPREAASAAQCGPSNHAA